MTQNIYALTPFSLDPLLIAGREDIILTYEKIDVFFLDLIKQVRGFLPAIFSVDLKNSFALSILNDDLLKKKIKERLYDDSCLVPFNSSKEWDMLAKELEVTPFFPQSSQFDFFNSKIEMTQLAESLDIPVAPFLQMNIDDFKREYCLIQSNWSKIFARADHGAGGRLAREISSEVDIIKLENKIKESTNPSEKVIINPFMNVRDSFCDLWTIGHTMHNIILTSQLLRDGSYYLGNLYPPFTSKQSLISQYSSRLCNALGEKGYKGHLGIDYFETEKGELFFSEVNGRVNGSTIAAIFFKEIGANAFMIKEFELHDNFSWMKLDDRCWFDGRKGVLPYGIDTYLFPRKYKLLVIGESRDKISEMVKND